MLTAKANEISPSHRPAPPRGWPRPAKPSTASPHSCTDTMVKKPTAPVTACSGADVRGRPPGADGETAERTPRHGSPPTRRPQDAEEAGAQGRTSLLGVCLNLQEDTVLPLVCELQSLEQTLYLRVTVGTDDVEGISGLIGKICFLEKDQQERK